MSRVEVWLCRPVAVADVSGLLRDDEAAATERFRLTADRARSATARALLRAAVARRAAAAPGTIAFARHCGACGSDEHGKPYAVGLDVQVSASHAGGVVAVAVADVPVGVDVEQGAAARFTGFAGVALHPHERASGTVPDPAAVWVRKEALLKVHGVGLARDPAGVDLGPRLGRDEVVDDADGPVGLADLDLTAYPGHVGAVAVAGAVVPRVRLRVVASPWDVAGPDARTPRS